MDYQTLTYTLDDGIAVVTLNRPERMNAMNQQMKDDLRACWTQVKDDPDIWVAIITGAGDAFSTAQWN